MGVGVAKVGWGCKVLVLMLVPGVALADSSAQEFAAVVSNAGHHATVLAAAKASPVWVADGCPAAVFTEQAEVGVYLPVVFGAGGLPTAGAWREGILASGCGKAVMLNVLTEVTGTGVLATGALLPGGTIADPELQNAAQRNAVAAAGGVPAGCHAAFVRDTMFVAYEGAGSPRAWREDWTVSLCGVVKTVVLRFTPDATGVGVAAAPDTGG